MSLFKQFETDSAKEQEGISIFYGPNDDGSIPEFRIRRRGPSNQKFAKSLDRLSTPYRKLIELKVLDEKIALRITMQAFVESVLISWKNVFGKDGKEFAFSEQNAMKLFEQLPDLYYDLQEKAGNMSLFMLEETEENAKN